MHWLRKKQNLVVNAGRDREMGGGITQPAANSIGQRPNSNPANVNSGSNHLMPAAVINNPNGEAEVTSIPDDSSNKHFQIKRWNACACWSWDVMHDTCVICRNALMSLCIHCQAKVGTNPLDESCLVAWGACNVGISMLFIMCASFQA
ncbi:unnamed protein product [Trichobilharzia szidati]|nr:unnamed protein product [Trichobilharzia szidati]